MSETAQKITEGQDSEQNRSKAQIWLEASAARVGAQKGVLLIRQGDQTTVVGAFPSKKSIDAEFEKFARQAFQNNRLIRRISTPSENTWGHKLAWIVFSLRISRRPAVVAFQLSVSDAKSDDALFAEIGSLILRRDDDSTAIASNEHLFKNHSLNTEQLSESAEHISKEFATADGLNFKKSEFVQIDSLNSAEKYHDDNSTLLLEEQSSVLNALATVLDQKDFLKSLHSFANGIAKNWHCFRVSIGLVRSRRIAIKAISGVVDFDPRSALIVDISQALQETTAFGSMIVLPNSDAQFAPPQCHMSLAAQLKNPALCSVPLVDGDQILGAILLERDHEFSELEQQQLQRMALLLTPIIALKKLEAMSSFEWLNRLTKKHLRSLLGSSKIGLKLGFLALVGFVVWSSLYTTMFKVDAKAEIEARVQRAVVAYAPSYLNQVERKAGDIVKKGDVLAQLDTEDLQLDRIKWVGELDKLTKEYRANLAQRDRSNIRILEARRSQAQSQIDLLDAKIERATLRAPIDGVVVSGDLSQVVGSPVEQGQLLFEVASLEEYRLSLMVDEADIGWVHIGNQGNLRLRSLPDQSFPFSITEITPVSESKNNANLFRVEASLAELPTNFRPGMHGFAKIEVEPRAIGWIWTRSFVNWLRIQAWKYGL